MLQPLLPDQSSRGEREGERPGGAPGVQFLLQVTAFSVVTRLALGFYFTQSVPSLPWLLFKGHQRKL